MVTPSITFSPDGTALFGSSGLRIRMTWQRLGQGRFTLSQADGAIWTGCLSEGQINIREPRPANRRARTLRYRPAPTLNGRLGFRETVGFPRGLTCIP